MIPRQPGAPRAVPTREPSSGSGCTTVLRSHVTLQLAQQNARTKHTVKLDQPGACRRQSRKRVARELLNFAVGRSQQSKHSDDGPPTSRHLSLENQFFAPRARAQSQDPAVLFCFGRLCELLVLLRGLIPPTVYAHVRDLREEMMSTFHSLPETSVLKKITSDKLIFSCAVLLSPLSHCHLAHANVCTYCRRRIGTAIVFLYEARFCSQ